MVGWGCCNLRNCPLDSARSAIPLFTPKSSLLWLLNIYIADINSNINIGRFVWLICLWFCGGGVLYFYWVDRAYYKSSLCL